ncbi:lysine N(6)-hydroxylase/L-ornithine N(5)-oxygenase family protein [Acinetobacter sp. WCHAc060025]|uniref:lysine N(6)-hydroxylase/L-ornithine N(5)-oxygenase family protein n=1 Tax=Acinetobacter sp. WCHAc060025 TaxID=2518625 RepID=UPI001023B269|nr:SidA/IucD/PvdA family monooxygenase [Acinetobacter sp. WCHAc060025]RZG76736.1 ornithine monooxygenase [Acinetobacter sp. WCHAc060025]
MLDFIGVGLGPFNLSLASLLHQKSDLDYLFFEKKAQFDWHAGMQLPHTVLQVPFMADLVSMVDPTSPFSFLNYLKAQQRLYKFYFLEQTHIPRREYNHYCQWVADQIEQIEYLSTVTSIQPVENGFAVSVIQDGTENQYLCRNLVLGVGNIPYLPKCLQSLIKAHPERCIHSSQYLDDSHRALKGNIVVLGSGQSAAEVFLDLFDQQYDYDRQQKAQFNLHWLTRASGFFPMEYAPLGLEHFSPDYLRHFYQFDELNKDLQLGKQSLLYKGISAQTIHEIYQKLYHRSIGGQPSSTHLHSQANLIDATFTDLDQVKLVFQDRVTLKQFSIDADFVVSATGYHTPEFEFLKQLKTHIQTNAQGRWQISEDYRVVHDAVGEIFVQNMEMHTHGVGVPDLGLGAHRAATIANQLLGYTQYDLGNTAQCFQHFNPFQNPEVNAYQSKSISQLSMAQTNQAFQQVKNQQPHSKEIKHTTHPFFEKNRI